jgi:hypothetical protein
LIKRPKSSGACPAQRGEGAEEGVAAGDVVVEVALLVLVVVEALAVKAPAGAAVVGVREEEAGAVVAARVTQRRVSF